MARNDSLRLSQQLCHPLYSASNALMRVYKKFLDPLDLTYPQYLILLALWEEDGINLNAISEMTYFDSGTLTPLIQKLKKKALIDVVPDPDDRRNKIVTLTAKGKRLKNQANHIPEKLGCLIPFSRDAAVGLVDLVRRLHRALLETESE